MDSFQGWTTPMTPNPPCQGLAMFLLHLTQETAQCPQMPVLHLTVFQSDKGKEVEVLKKSICMGKI